MIPEFIVEMAKRYPGELTIIAVGPLQNVARALRPQPNLGKYFTGAVSMNGCIHGTTGRPSMPLPEFKTRASTRDSQLVYAAGRWLTIAPLGSTTRVRFGEEERAAIRKYDAPLTRLRKALDRLWISNAESPDDNARPTRRRRGCKAGGVFPNQENAYTARRRCGSYRYRSERQAGDRMPRAQARRIRPLLYRGTDLSQAQEIS